MASLSGGIEYSQEVSDPAHRLSCSCSPDGDGLLRRQSVGPHSGLPSGGDGYDVPVYSQTQTCLERSAKIPQWDSTTRCTREKLGTSLDLS